MEITAAITRVKGEPFEIATLQLDDPAPGEVRVKLAATGVCHTDAITRDQVYPTPFRLYSAMKAPESSKPLERASPP